MLYIWPFWLFKSPYMILFNKYDQFAKFQTINRIAINSVARLLADQWMENARLIEGSQLIAASLSLILILFFYEQQWCRLFSEVGKDDQLGWRIVVDVETHGMIVSNSASWFRKKMTTWSKCMLLQIDGNGWKIKN